MTYIIPPCPMCGEVMVADDEAIICIECGDVQPFAYAVCEEEQRE